MNSKAARRYTLALYGLAEEKGKLDEITKDINYVLSVIDSHKDLELFFASPIVNKNKKLIAVKEIFQNKISELTMNFLNLLIMRRREKLVPDICRDFINLRNEREGIVNVQVKTSVDLSEDEKLKMRLRIEAYSKLKSNLRFEIDKSIIGGFVAKIGDTVLDASIKRQLETLRDKFKSGGFELN